MKPLIYLFVRSFVNGLRRTFTSPKRTLGFIFFASYYFFAVIRPFGSASSQFVNFPHHPKLSMPPIEVLDGCIFGVMGTISLFLLANVASYKGAYRPADVDVLFATPVSPKLVLVFRMVRDYLFTLIAPLIIGIFAYRGASLGLDELFRNYPTHGADILRLTWISWMLLSLSWVSISYAVSMFVGRSDLKSDVNHKVINFVLAAITLSSIGYVAVRLRGDLSWETALDLSHSPFLRVAFFPATLATEMVVQGVQGNLAMALLYFAASAGIIVASFAAAMTQVGWLYDQAAAKGLSAAAMRSLRRSGSAYSLMAMRAREGKLKRGRLSGTISGWRLTGAPALLWKELLMQMRGTLAGSTLIMVVIAFGYGAVAYGLGPPSQGAVVNVMLLLLSGMAGYMFALTNGFSGFRELLLKVDLIKPIPISPAKTIFWEILAKAPIPCLQILIGCLFASIVSPSLALSSAGSFLFGVSVLFESLGAVLLTLMLFPDYEDPTQRGLSGLVMLLAIALSVAPGVALLILLLVYFRENILIATIPSFLLSIGITAGMAAISGGLYMGFNPNE
jgi:Putative ABC exporter